MASRRFPLWSLVLLALAPLATACSSSSDAAVDGASGVVTSCGSPIGDAVATAAEGGESTIDGALTTRANDVVAGPFVGGEAIADGIADLISQAKHEVLIEFFDIEVESWTAARIREAIAALPSTVHVYVMVNPDGHQRFFGFLPEKTNDGVKRLNEFFHDPKVTVGIWNGATGIHQLHVMHSKQVVVDGARAFVTDTNLQGNADPQSRGGRGWHQLGIVVEGAVAHGLREDAAQAWRHSTPSATLPPAPAGRNVVACKPMTVLGRHEGAGEDSSADRGYAAFLRAATRELRVITPNLNDDGALSALSDATAKADVYIVLSKGFNDANEKIPSQGGTNEHNVGRLAGSAKNKCHLHMRWYAVTNGVAVDGNVGGANHAKWASADGQAMILGSQNLDTQSWKQSRELSLFIDDGDITSRFDDVFRADWSRGAVAYEATGCR